MQFHGGHGSLTKHSGEWVRQKQFVSLEQAVRRQTFDSAPTFGIYDRGLLRPGMAADVVIFDPATVKCGHETVVRDFPKGAWRIKEPAEGIFATIVNGVPLRGRQAHRRPPRSCPAQQLLARHPRLSQTPYTIPSGRV